jgi:hypothetical protein
LKKSLILFFVLLLSASLMAQVRSGTIWGHVTDTQGAPLPGVSITLTSPYSAPVTVVTDTQGIYRFPSLDPSSRYALTAELQGFKKVEKTGIIVIIGQQSKIDITMEQGKIEEEVTVVAVTPTIDSKKTSVGKNVNQEMLQALPTARDPWVVMQMAAGVIMDRENVGGSESGQQSGFYAKGDPTGGNNNVWAIDGVVVTDAAAVGASPTYWDFDSFEEMNITTGGADVTIQTGGVALNMVTRRGGNRVSLGGRFYLTDSYFQANNLTAALEAEGVTGINKINQIKDYGFNLGGPVWKDHVWLWMSYGIQDINAVNLTGSAQIPILTNYNFKLNVQPMASNRFEAMYIAGKKTFLGRSASPSFPQGYYQDDPYHFGSPIIKIQDEQTVGENLLVSAKFGWMGNGFSMVSAFDPNNVTLNTYDETTGIQTGGFWGGFYYTRRPMWDYDLHVQYYNDKLFGVSHEIKLGVEYSTRRTTSDSSNPGQLQEYYDLNAPDLSWALNTDYVPGTPGFTPGMAQFFLGPGVNLDFRTNQFVAFLQDTVTAGRFNFLLGLRYDRQTPWIASSTYPTVDENPVWNMFDSDVKDALAAFMPPLTVPTFHPDYHWNVWSPRLGVTYDLFGNGKTILKLSGALYGDFMGTYMSYDFNPYGTPYYYDWNVGMNFYWYDANHNGTVQAGEVYGYNPDTFAPIPLIANGAVNPDFTDQTVYNQYWGFTPYSTSAGPTNYIVDPKAGSSHTWELLFSIDHELLQDFSVSLQASYRRYDHFSWDVPYYADGALGDYSIDGQNVILSPTAYDPVGTIPSDITYIDDFGNPQTVNLGAGPGNTYYLLDPLFTGTPYEYHTLNTNYNTYYGVDLVFNKRLSHKWMLDGSISYMDQRMHYGNGYTDPTNLWALQDTYTAPQLGYGSGKVGAYIFSHWMVKLEGLYQLPLGFDASFTFNARAGYLIPHYMTIVDDTWANYIYPSATAYLDVFGSEKLPTHYQLNLRLEKMVKVFDTGRIYLMADFFNVTNAATINRRYDRNEGTLYIYERDESGNITDYSFSPYAFNHAVNEIMNPFIARFGVRFQF